MHRNLQQTVVQSTQRCYSWSTRTRNTRHLNRSDLWTSKTIVIPMARPYRSEKCRFTGSFKKPIKMSTKSIIRQLKSFDKPKAIYRNQSILFVSYVKRCLIQNKVLEITIWTNIRNTLLCWISCQLLLLCPKKRLIGVNGKTALLSSTPRRSSDNMWSHTFTKWLESVRQYTPLK